MAFRVFCWVEKVALAVIKVTKPKYSRELLKMLPVDLCQTIITDGNFNQIIARINRFRCEKEDDFARVSGLDLDWKGKPEERKKMCQLVDSSSDELNPVQEVLQREIKFLSNLGRSIYSLRFIERETI